MICDDVIRQLKHNHIIFYTMKIEKAEDVELLLKTNKES